MTLCTEHTTTPSTIPQGKHVIHVSKVHWKLRIENDDLYYVYTCVKDSCTPYHRDNIIFIYDYVKDVNESCVTINHVQNISTLNFVSTNILQSNDLTLQSRRDVHFYVTYEGECTSVCGLCLVFVVYLKGPVSQGLCTLSLKLKHRPGSVPRDYAFREKMAEQLTIQTIHQFYMSLNVHI